MLKYSDLYIGFILFYQREFKQKSIHLDYIGIDSQYNGYGLSKLMINFMLNKYENYQITLECINSLTGFYYKFGFQLFKSNFVSYYNKFHWNIMYLNKKPKYDMVFNEFYNYKVKYNDIIFLYLIRMRYCLLIFNYFHLNQCLYHYYLKNNYHYHYIHQFVDYRLNIVPKIH